MNRIGTFLAASAVLILGALSVPQLLSAQDAQAGFAAKVAVQLRADGWSPTELAAFTKEADALDWQGAAGASPQVVALSLEFAASEAPYATPQLRAQLALELAIAAANMNRVGIDEHSAAAAELQAVRTMLRQTDQLRTRDRTMTQLQASIKDCAQTAVRTAMQVQTRTTLRNGGASAGSTGSGFAYSAQGTPNPVAPRGRQ